MNDCIFCKIVNGQIPADKIYEDEKVFIFLDINPVSEGHCLVIPKEHRKMMADVPDQLLSYMFVKSKDFMKILKKALNADYVALSVVGIDVPHFHIHLVPRHFNDKLDNFWPTGKYKEGEAKKVTDKIKKFL